ncbi:MAG: DUF1028 domain-containing protein [Chloroflexota bacterium]|nr:DUF1028 domain-containing protein [Chloroflexota bacterium]
MTYSIVARDPATGRLGIAVHSHYLVVGPPVVWAEAGVGAIATQASVDISFGPIGLELLRNGRSAEKVVAALVASDTQPEDRQLGVVDAKGTAASYTGPRCIPAAGNIAGEGYTVQGNLLERETCWPAMARAYGAATDEGLPFAERLLRALEAAEAEGGDVRGRQSAAMVIVSGELHAAGWRGRLLDLRVDDHPDPVPELRRLVALHDAYDLLSDEGDAARAGTAESDRYAEARRRAPEAMELAFWMGVEQALRGEVEAGRQEIQTAIAADARWRTTLEHLAASGHLGEDPSLLDRLLS